jgi:PAS domain S-box-containing protein
MPEPPFKRVEALFYQAAALEPGQRSTFLDARCAGDTELRRAVEELLEQDAGVLDTRDFLVSPIIRAATRPSAAVPPALAPPGLVRADEMAQDQVPIAAAGRQVPPAEAAAGQPAVMPQSRYALGGIHATGGMGRVWLARDTFLAREVALKELRPEIAGDALVRCRFLREARITGQLEHPGIVPVYELARHPDSSLPFYTMRFVKGRTLTEAAEAFHRKRRQGAPEPFELTSLLNAFAAVCHTVAYAHSRGVIHRDLKGANVILGDFGEVIVLDWGLAKRLDQRDDWPPGHSAGDEVDAGCTSLGDVMGTPAFMAPEQASGRMDQVDRRSDIYGLGAILYQVLTGQPPFPDADSKEVLAQVVAQEPVRPRALWPEVPPALEAACLRALAKDPDDRWPSAGALGEEVQHWQELQRRQAEEALRRQSEVLQSILNSMSAAVVVADKAGALLLSNPAAQRMLGILPTDRTVEEAKRRYQVCLADGGTPWPPDEQPLARAIRGIPADEVEAFLRSSAREEGLWVSANARPLTDETGAIRGGVVVLHDITEQKLAEQALRRSRERFELAVAGSQDGLWDWDLQTNVVYYSPRWKSILGYGAEDVADRLEEWETRLHPDERERVLAANYAHINGATPYYECEYRMRHKDGSYRWVLARGVALRDASGKAYRMAGSHVDITERKWAEEERQLLLAREREARADAEAAVRVLEEAREALRASEEQYRSLADLIPGVVWTARPDGWVDYANQFWCDFTGMTVEQTEGSRWAAMLHPDDAQRVLDLWANALRTGEPIEAEYRLKRAADGAYPWFLARAKALRDRDGRIVKWFGTLTEIEGQKQGEKALERQNALLRLLHHVSVAAYEARTVEEALQVGIDQVCACTGWPIGHVYVLAGDGSQELVPTTIWHLDRPGDFETFVRVTEASRLAAGVGLPGRVLARKEPLWVMDVTQEDHFPRAKAAANLGVKGAFGFPVLSAAGVVAVLEFFTSEPKEPDEPLLQGMVQVGIQLGQVFARKRAEEALRAATTELARCQEELGRRASKK